MIIKYKNIIKKKNPIIFQVLKKTKDSNKIFKNFYNYIIGLENKNINNEKKFQKIIHSFPNNINKNFESYLWNNIKKNYKINELILSDLFYNQKYLLKLYKDISKISKILKKEINFKTKNKIICFVHIYDPKDKFVLKKNILKHSNIDFYVTYNFFQFKGKIYKEKFHNAIFEPVPNIGRDFFGFKQSIKKIINHNIYIKFHFKKRNQLTQEKLNISKFNKILNFLCEFSKMIDLKKNNKKLYALKGTFLNQKDNIFLNKNNIQKILKKNNLSLNSFYNSFFPSGGVFIVIEQKNISLKQLIKLIEQKKFSTDFGHKDGKYENYLERFIGFYFKNKKFRFVEIEKSM